MSSAVEMAAIESIVVTSTGGDSWSSSPNCRGDAPWRSTRLKKTRGSDLYL